MNAIGGPLPPDACGDIEYQASVAMSIVFNRVGYFQTAMAERFVSTKVLDFKSSEMRASGNGMFFKGPGSGSLGTARTHKSRAGSFREPAAAIPAFDAPLLYPARIRGHYASGDEQRESPPTIPTFVAVFHAHAGRATFSRDHR